MRRVGCSATSRGPKVVAPALAARTLVPPARRTARANRGPGHFVRGRGGVPGARLGNDPRRSGSGGEEGRPCQVQEEGGTSYHVLRGGHGSLCCGPGFERWGMGRGGKGCRHIASLSALVRAKGL